MNQIELPMNSVSVSAHLRSLFMSVFSLIRSPETLPGNLLETFTEWTRHRKWNLIWFTLPALVALLGFLFTGIFLAFRSNSSIVQGSLLKVDKKIPLDDLTALAFEEHYYRNRIKPRPDPNIYFEDTASDESSLGSTDLVANEELVRSSKFRDSDVLLRRACSVSSESIQARFRLALLASLDTTLPNPVQEADEIMGELAENEAEIFPAAHAWMAVSLLGQERQLEPFELRQLETHLKNASQWKSIEPGLLSIYSSICLQTGKPEKAMAIAKLAAEYRPELNLAYAQICKMVGPEHDKEMIRAAKAAEEAFNARLGTPLETDNDRLGLAETLLLRGERDRAVEVLKSGLSEDPEEHKPIRRGLADLYIDKFRADNEALINKERDPSASDESTAQVALGSDPEQPEGPNPIDWTNLEIAAKFDRENPIVGQEIAVQWRKLAKPPADLLKVLGYQLQNDIASNGSRLMIAELFLIEGRVKDARQQWETVLKKDPYVIPALNNLAVLLSRETPPQLDRAIELIDRAYRIQPMSAEMCDTYGEVYMNAGHPMDAIAKLEESIRIDSTRKITRKRLAECYRQLGMSEMAHEQEAQIRRLEEAEAEAKPSSTKK